MTDIEDMDWGEPIDRSKKFDKTESQKNTIRMPVMTTKPKL